LLKAIILPIPKDDPVAWSICMSYCIPVTLMHSAQPTLVVPSNIVLDGFWSPTVREIRVVRLGIETPVKICIANCGQTVTDIAQ